MNCYYHYGSARNTHALQSYDAQHTYKNCTQHYWRTKQVEFNKTQSLTAASAPLVQWHHRSVTGSAASTSTALLEPTSRSERQGNAMARNAYKPKVNVHRKISYSDRFRDSGPLKSARQPGFKPRKFLYATKGTCLGYSSRQACTHNF